MYQFENIFWRIFIKIDLGFRFLDAWKFKKMEKIWAAEKSKITDFKNFVKLRNI